MANIIGSRFKIFFIFLLVLTFSGILFLYKSNYCSLSTKLWLCEVTQHSFYSSLKSHILKHTSFQISLLQANQTFTTPVIFKTKINATDQPISGQLYHMAYPLNYHFIIDEPHKCQHEKPFLILMVPVAPHQLGARNAIRRTWGNESVVQKKRISVVFTLGLSGGHMAHEQHEQLKNESMLHRDLIQGNFMDTYQNLTIKTMVIMHWLATSCPQATFAMKVDSDMFINPENLINLLTNSKTPRMNYITGMIMWHRPVVRNINSKWYVSKEDYSDEFYPTYLLGMGYVFSMDLPEKIVKISKEVKSFPIEDAYIGACLSKLGISPSQSLDPSQFRAYHSGNFEHKTFSRVITSILGSPEQLVDYWHKLKHNTTLTKSQS